MRLVVLGLFAGLCYSMGFNAGYDEGEGRIQRRQRQQLTERAAETDAHAANAGVAQVHGRYPDATACDPGVQQAPLASRTARASAGNAAF
jgi:hypothetical protein